MRLGWFFGAALFQVVICGPAFAQCSPTASSCPPIYSLTYHSDRFNIPIIWPFFDGTAARTNADCGTLEEKLRAENGKGLVTEAVEEFFSKLEAACRRMNRNVEDLFQAENGDWCIETMEERWIVPQLSAGDFCKELIGHIQVKDMERVTVTFLGMPCQRSRRHHISCWSPDGRYSPHLEPSDVDSE
ncbi:MAG: hypothetical protein RL417_742 [Pseudomonadota bacterium]|jgi:hypothetical protein